MKLTLDNIGGIRLRPYGQGTSKLYGLGSIRKVTPSGRGLLVGDGVLLPGVREATGMVLDLNGCVYLHGVKVWNPSTASYDDGGYLGEVTTTLSIRYDNYAEDQSEREQLQETCSFTSLGIVPASQITTPAMKVTNLSFQTQPMAYRNHGTELSPSVSQPYGDRVGETYTQPSQVTCVHLNRASTQSRWADRLMVVNASYNDFGIGKQDNFTVNYDGEYVPKTLANLAMKGVLVSVDRRGISFDLSGNQGAFQ